MGAIKFIGNVISLIIFSFVFSCAYFNTLYNAQQYFDEAETHRLEKEGRNIPLSAIDKYGKTIQKCQKSLNEYPNSRWKIDAYLLMSKARYYRKDYDIALENLDTVIKKVPLNRLTRANIGLLYVNGKRVLPALLLVN